MNLEELFKGRDMDIAAVMERLKDVAAELSLPWGMRTETFNSRRAQELGKWAESLNRGKDFHLAVFQTYFARGKNIADISVLKGIAASIGLDGQKAEQALVERTFKEAVDRDWQYSRACGITAVPTFMVHGRKLVGAQPYQALASLIEFAERNTRK